MITGDKTNQEIVDFAQAVRSIERGISIHITGAYLEGTYRGKRENAFRYCYTSKSFDYKGEAYQVEEAFNIVATK